MALITQLHEQIFILCKHSVSVSSVSSGEKMSSNTSEGFWNSWEWRYKAFSMGHLAVFFSFLVTKQTHFSDQDLELEEG